ncbi:MAG: hypothetical protein IT162_23275 [Bryobacterales bacterium]|nr:hypothetical protein [Bryobacterales bacterium]
MRRLWWSLLCVACAVAGPAESPRVIEESVAAITVLRVLDAAWQPWTVVEIAPPPQPPGHALYRLAAPGAAAVWLDGVRLPASADDPGYFELPYLHPKRSSRAALAGWPAGVRVAVTPRVFIPREEIAYDPSTGRVEARVWVRNSLENTVNAVIVLTVPGVLADLSESATVPPGVTQAVTLSGHVAAGQNGAGWRLSVEKQEEAMEGGYRFMKNTQTVNFSRKP